MSNPTEKFDENELTDREKRLLDIIISVDDKYSVTEVEEKAKVIFSNYVYENPTAFTHSKEKETSKINFSVKTTTNKRYGNLFD